MYIYIYIYSAILGHRPPEHHTGQSIRTKKQTPPTQTRTNMCSLLSTVSDGIKHAPTSRYPLQDLRYMFVCLGCKCYVHGDRNWVS